METRKPRITDPGSYILDYVDPNMSWKWEPWTRKFLYMVVVWSSFSFHTTCSFGMPFITTWRFLLLVFYNLIKLFLNWWNWSSHCFPPRFHVHYMLCLWCCCVLLSWQNGQTSLRKIDSRLDKTKVYTFFWGRLSPKWRNTHSSWVSHHRYLPFMLLWS